MVNPLYPFAAIQKEFLNNELEGLISLEEEKILAVAHILLKKNNGLMIVTNQRLIIYQTKNNSLFNRALNLGWDELKGAAIGAIPVVGDLMGAKETVSSRLGVWKEIVNRKAVKLKEAKEQQEAVDKLAETFQLPEEQLLASQEFTLIFQDQWSSLEKVINGIRIIQNQIHFEPVSGMTPPPEKEEGYRNLFKKKIKFHHEDIGFLLASFLIPNLDLLKKRNWNLYFDGQNLLFSKENLDDPALDEVLEEVKKINFFGYYPEEFFFEAASAHPWQPKATGAPQTAPPSEPLSLEEASFKRKKGLFIFKKSKILSLVEAEEISSKLGSFITQLKTEPWVGEVDQVSLCGGSTAKLSILLAHVAPKDQHSDEWFWFFVGALPQCYLNARFFPNPAAALDYYFKELIKYNQAVQTNEETTHLLPFMDKIEPQTALDFEKSLPIVHKYLLKGQLNIMSAVT